jgi:hypothetical protein
MGINYVLLPLHENIPNMRPVQIKPIWVLSCDKDIKATVMAVAPAAARGCLPQCPWGLFVTASTSSRTILKRVSFNQPSYKRRFCIMGQF